MQPQEAVLCPAAALIRQGGVLIYPTETFYGLGADPRREGAVARIFEIKGRVSSKPLPLIAADLDSVLSVVSQWPHRAELLARAFWPGPLTLILHASDRLPQWLHAGTGKIALRISPHPVAGALSHLAGGLLISTSANPSQEPPHADPDRIPVPFLAKVDGLLHAGRLPGGLPSTIVDLSNDAPLLLRRGQVPWDRIREVIGM
jgi:L-threonylcarbamoyladenylate synthase